MTAVKLFLSQEVTLGQIAMGMITKNLSFKSRHSTGKNKSRWRETKWWQNFKGASLKVNLSHVPESTLLPDKLVWALRMVSSTYKMIILALTKDNAESENMKYLLNKIFRSIVETDLSKEKVNQALSASPDEIKSLKAMLGILDIKKGAPSDQEEKHLIESEASEIN